MNKAVIPSIKGKPNPAAGSHLSSRPRRGTAKTFINNAVIPSIKGKPNPAAGSHLSSRLRRGTANQHRHLAPKKRVISKDDIVGSSVEVPLDIVLYKTGLFRNDKIFDSNGNVVTGNIIGTLGEPDKYTNSYPIVLNEEYTVTTKLPEIFLRRIEVDVYKKAAGGRKTKRAAKSSRRRRSGKRVRKTRR